MTTTKKVAKRIYNRRYQQRQAGVLPPLCICRRCGARCKVETYLPFCGRCADQLGAPGTQHGDRANPRQAAAMRLLWELRTEVQP